jgi:hypothetical protein
MTNSLLVESTPGQWTTPVKGQTYCSGTNLTKIKFSFGKLTNGIIRDTYVQVHPLDNPGMIIKLLKLQPLQTLK